MYTFEPEHTAVLLMDYQAGIVSRYSPEPGALLSAADRVLNAARRRSLPIIYVRVGFRPGFPEVSPRNLRFRSLPTSGQFQEGPATDIDPRVAPQGHDIVVVKHRVGAFTGTDLDMILRARDVHTLVMLGIATSGVVLSTLRTAADLDYQCIVVRDGCADRDPEVHHILMERVFPSQTWVVNADELCTKWLG